MIERILAPVPAAEMEILPPPVEVTINEIARALGMTVPAARVKAWRARWPHRHVSSRDSRGRQGGPKHWYLYRVDALPAEVRQALGVSVHRANDTACALARYFCEPGPGWTPPDSAESARKRAAPGPDPKPRAKAPGVPAHCGIQSPLRKRREFLELGI